MKRVLCPRLPAPDRPVELPEEEARHALRVLRLRDGDRIEIIDGRGGRATGRLRSKGEKAWAEADSTPATAAPATAAGVVPVRLELAVLKGDAMEWAIEKAVELGIRSLQPVLTERTVVRTGGKGPEAFQERWRKIADQALKQCGRLERLDVEPPIPLEEVLAAQPGPRFWCDEAAGAGEPFLLDAFGGAESLRVLVGPEGGWAPRERELLARSGATRATLGPLTLRAETAALFAAGLAQAHFRRARRDA
jgi:16S rRNA (uracil1498-N3)-methyltransferase